MKIRFFIWLCFIFCGYASLANARRDAHNRTQDIYIPDSSLNQMIKTEKIPPLTTKPRPNSAPLIEPPQPSASLIGQPQSSFTAKNTRQPNVMAQFSEAPVDRILAKQPYRRQRLNKYKEKIVRSYSMRPNELKKLLENEMTAINKDTRQMQQLLASWEGQSPAYKFANYQLNSQISKDIVKSRKEYKKRKQIFADFFTTAPKSKPISIIEATDPLFWLVSNPQISAFRTSLRGNYYISFFDSEHRHFLTYNRLNVDANHNRRILAVPSRNPKIDLQFQQLFDSYNNDLRRIGKGLDITNPVLLRQIGTMQNKFITETY